jgi:hypothetical protein
MNRLLYIFAAMCFSLFIGVLPCSSSLAGDSPNELANVDYVHRYIKQATNAIISSAEAGKGKFKVANIEYLLAVIDELNKNTGSLETNYRSDAANDFKNDPENSVNIYTAIPVESVWQGTNDLFNCMAGGYWKDGAIDTSNGAGNVQCRECTNGYYCPEGSNNRNACKLLDGSHAEGIYSTGSSPSTIEEDYPQIYTWNPTFYTNNPTYNNTAVFPPDSVDYYETDLTSHGIWPDYHIQSMCSNNAGASLPPVYSSAGTHCWCRLKRVSDVESGQWVPGGQTFSSSNDCDANCAHSCAYGTAFDQEYRVAMLDAFQNRPDAGTGATANTDCKYYPYPIVPEGCKIGSCNWTTYTGTAWPSSNCSLLALPGYDLSGTLHYCTDCIPGKYGPGGTERCTVCPKNSYCPHMSSAPTSCNTVGAGYVTSCEGQKSENNCYYDASSDTEDAAKGIATYNGTPVNFDLAGVGIYPDYKVQSICSLQKGEFKEKATCNPTHTSTGNFSYCWCRLKSQILEQDGKYKNGEWVLLKTLGVASACNYNCPYSCAGEIFNDSAFRATLLDAYANPN